MSVRLFVLGVLHDIDTHGYHIKEIARASNLDRWSDIAYGSIYHALNAMEKEGLIEQSGVEQEGDRPPRKLYRITKEGRGAFQTLLQETSEFGYNTKHPINLALPFITHFSPDERTARLEQRIRRLEERRETVMQRRE